MCGKAIIKSSRGVQFQIPWTPKPISFLHSLHCWKSWCGGGRGGGDVVVEEGAKTIQFRSLSNCLNTVLRMEQAPCYRRHPSSCHLEMSQRGCEGVGGRRADGIQPEVANSESTRGRHYPR